MKAIKMNRLLSVLAVAAALGMCSERAVAGTLQIVHSIDLPFEPGAGLSYDLGWDGQHIWALTIDLLWGFQTYQLDPSDGDVLSSFEMEPPNTWGLTWDGNHLWHTVTLLDGGSTVPPRPDDPDSIQRRSTDGTLISSVLAPNSPRAMLTGATWDGQHLWVSDAENNVVSQVQPADGRVMGSFASPDEIPLGLAWDGTFLWLVGGANQVLYQIDTGGNVVETWTSAARKPFGITFDGQDLWVSDNATGKILRLVMPEPPTLALLGCAIVSLACVSWRRRKRFGKGKYRRR